MTVLRYVAIFVLGGISLTTIATSETLMHGKRLADPVAAELD